jgi:hypothetical protein
MIRKLSADAAGRVETGAVQFRPSRAYEVLKEAEHVVFIGYSMPLIDVGGGFLF